MIESFSYSLHCSLFTISNFFNNITWPYTLSLRFKQAKFVREGEMLTNSSVIPWNVKNNRKNILTLGCLFILLCVQNYGMPERNEL